jgi:spoIIIJ-associated protein
VETPQTIEAVGSDLEDAITRGLEALNAARSEVDVLVLETNPRATRVRLTIKGPHSQPVSSDDVKTAERVVTELLNKMKLPASVSAQTAAALDAQDEQQGPTITIDVQGENLGSLIGRRGETLDNLQYIARLLAAKEIGRYVNLVIDVEGYKSHRAEVLKQLALNLAERVVSSRKPMSLEPMPANERRIVHLALREHPGVRTESSGLGERRKVTIFPKSMKR